MQDWYWLILFAVLGALTYKQWVPIKGYRTMKAHPFQGLLRQTEDKILIDVREFHEYKKGFIPGAINIPLGQLPNRIDEIPHGVTVFLYCTAGVRSRKAAYFLSKQGYTDLVHLQRGLTQWTNKQKGKPGLGLENVRYKK